MKPGPAPKPTAVKKLLGNPGRRRLNEDEPRLPVPATAPQAPRVLNHEAKREWRRLVAMLIKAGLYTEVDRAALALYCQAWGRWVEAERKVSELGLMRETGTGYEYLTAWRQEANKAFDQLNRMIQQFGLSPSARSQIHVGGHDQSDDFMSLLFGAEVEVGMEASSTTVSSDDDTDATGGENE